jgi:hypothetical protein
MVAIHKPSCSRELYMKIAMGTCMSCERGSSACWIRHNSVGHRRATHKVCVYALRLLADRMEQQLGRLVDWSCPALLAIGLWRD